MSDHLLVPAAALADLATYVGRARRVDPDGAVRLVAVGSGLAVYVSPVHGSGGPTVLGLRVLPLAEPSDVDVTVALAAVTDRLAHLTPSVSAPADEPIALAVPPVQVTDAGWAGVSPPRTGWDDAGSVTREVLEEAVRAGTQEIADGAPEGSGAQAVARLRALVWGRDVPGAPGLPAGAAYTADALGFLGPDTAEVAVLARGSWRRLSTPRGHVLARPSLL
ncbi:hypothetical protein [Angustibacter sp. Root456]|uniref:hypothetical protein n=1 Tax=Angustibacter sp. Root456 TaxID=1736539 RepID=UPI0006F4BA06|nr:hypothetical protein [Angustibacter sp. Root456]KQX65761.1 hypothetical protein ASD06_09115 [Angustibacter sp. Root456]